MKHSMKGQLGSHFDLLHGFIFGLFINRLRL